MKPIEALGFIDMADLLQDNLELNRREDNSTDKEASNTGKRRPREVSQHLGAVFYYLRGHRSSYSPEQDERPTGIYETDRPGGAATQSDGWRQYDVTFKKYAASHPSVQWGQPLPSMYASFFLTPTQSSSPDEHCLEGDHISSQCALAPYPPPLFSSGSLTPPLLRARPPTQPPWRSRTSLRGQSVAVGIKESAEVSLSVHTSTRVADAESVDIKWLNALTSQTILAQLPHVPTTGLANHGSMG